MNEKVLVAYASKYGATREIAERIGAVLGKAGLPAEVLPVSGAQNPGAYRAVVLGSAVYVGKWQKDAAAFVQKHEKALSERPVWLFSSGPSGAGDPQQLVEGWRLPAEVKACAERIRPRDAAVFHGNIDPQKINGM
ncbi:MAG: flavodoxin domain-containing protein, partial [Anaerolineaceae bacterium]